MLRNALALVTGAIVLVAAFLFSVVVLAVVAVLGLAALGTFMWKTRKLRRAMRMHASGGKVIDGEVIVVGESVTTTHKALPREPKER